MSHQKSAADLAEEIQKGQEKIKRLQQKQKQLQAREKDQLRRERVRRLCTRAGMLESFLVRPEEITDDEVMELLRLSFNQYPVKNYLERILNKNTVYVDPDDDEDMESDYNP